MSFVSKIMLFLIFLSIGIGIANLLPSSLIDTHQNNAVNNTSIAKIKDKSRIEFQNVSLPKYYPLLLKYLEKNHSEKITWQDDSGAEKNIFLSFTQHQGLSIETELFLGAAINDTQISAQPLQVRMVDQDTDGVMDSIELFKADGDSKKFHRPFDEIQSYMWDVSLAISFRLSQCCK